jgi:hypothetical protein
MPVALPPDGRYRVRDGATVCTATVDRGVVRLAADVTGRRRIEFVDVDPARAGM